MARLVRAIQQHQSRREGAGTTAPFSLTASRGSGADKPGRDGGKPRALVATPLALATVFFCGDAVAGAWPVPVGETLTILKAERAQSDESFDLDGERYATPERTDDTLSLYVEHGLTERVTLQGKLAWTRGEEAGADYAGRGPLELGLRYTFVKQRRMSAALYVGGVAAGEGRNAGYAEPGQGGTDIEVRLLAGRSFTAVERPVFVEAQVARLARSGLPDETRLDLTAGFEPAPGWLVLAQSYTGWTQADPAWTKLEISSVHDFGEWRLQAGWRASVAGKASPVEGGPVLGIWRRF